MLLVLERSVIKGKQCCDNACEKYTNLPHIKEFYVLFIGNQLKERKGAHVLGLIDFWGPIQMIPCLSFSTKQNVQIKSRFSCG